MARSAARSTRASIANQLRGDASSRAVITSARRAGVACRASIVSVVAMISSVVALRNAASAGVAAIRASDSPDRASEPAMISNRQTRLAALRVLCIGVSGPLRAAMGCLRNPERIVFQQKRNLVQAPPLQWQWLSEMSAQPPSKVRASTHLTSRSRRPRYTWRERIMPMMS